MESKLTTLVLVFAAVASVGLLLSTRQNVAVENVSAVDSDVVMYFIPEDQSSLHPDVSARVAQESGIEDYEPVDLRPASLQSLDVLNIESTSNWDVVAEKAAQGDLRAVIIHNDALESLTQPDIDSLRLILRSGVAVAGIGIPGDQLANDILGMPSLFNALKGLNYTNEYYYYAYFINVEGPPEDVIETIKAFEQDVSSEEAMASLSSGNQTLIQHSSASDGLFSGGLEYLLIDIKSMTAPQNLTPIITPEVAR